MVRALPFLLAFGLVLFCAIDAITAPDREVRNLPKIVWVVLILVFVPIGAIAWLIAGRPRGAAEPLGWRGARHEPIPDDLRDLMPETDAEFRERVRRRAEEQRARAAEQQRRLSETPDEDDA